MNGNHYLEHANEQLVVMTAMETPEAVENIEEIVTVAGLDGIFIGLWTWPLPLAIFAILDIQRCRRQLEKLNKQFWLLINF